MRSQKKEKYSKHREKNSKPPLIRKAEIITKKKDEEKLRLESKKN